MNKKYFQKSKHSEDNPALSYFTRYAPVVYYYQQGYLGWLLVTTCPPCRSTLESGHTAMDLFKT